MRAVVYKGPKQVAVEEVENPRVERPTDALIRITSSGICGTDLHIYQGRRDIEPGLVFGHEAVGLVEEVGGAVYSIKTGERVAIIGAISCGFCYNCLRGYHSSCLTPTPGAVGGGFGLGGHRRGSQAEYFRVPFADVNCMKLPGEPGDDLEDDFLTIPDIFPTGYQGAEQARVQPGSTVAVFGAGPVGLMAAYSSVLKGASEVYIVDQVPERLRWAEEHGAIPIDFTKGDPVEQIYEERRRSKAAQAMRPGEEKMMGVMCGIDAVGYEAFDRSDPHGEKPTQVIEDLVRVVNPTGAIALIGAYYSSDPRGIDESAKHGMYNLPLGEIFRKGLTMSTGTVQVKRYAYLLRDLILSGRARPGTVFSHHMPLESAPEAYQRFEWRGGGYTKIALKPETKKAA